MLAMSYSKYGGPDVVKPIIMKRPEPGPGEVLVRVKAAGVTTADWRIRASEFPGGLWLLGRLMMGLFRPKHSVLGGDFAGDVAGLGEGVTNFRLGDPVFGFSQFGAHAEYLVMKADGAIARRPAGLSASGAAALPFGAICALDFLQRKADLKAGQKILILGASGGVGSYAVQIAKWLGADVTAVASGPNRDLVIGLGADHFIDYTHDDPASLPQEFDVVFDTIGALNFARARRILTAKGLFLPLNFGLKDVLPALLARTGPRMVLHVNEDRQEQVEAIAELVQNGHLKPVIDQIYPFRSIAEAYSHVESRRRRGAIILDVADQMPKEKVA